MIEQNPNRIASGTPAGTLSQLSVKQHTSPKVPYSTYHSPSSLQTGLNPAAGHKEQKKEGMIRRMTFAPWCICCKRSLSSRIRPEIPHKAPENNQPSNTTRVVPTFMTITISISGTFLRSHMPANNRHKKD
jgi:hypothetical protein